MATGQPDWHTRPLPQYTELKWRDADETLDPGETFVLFSEEGVGVIHGGMFWTEDADYHDESVWYIEIDEVNVAQFRLRELREFGIYSQCGFPFFIIKDSPTENLIRIGIQPGIRFESKCVLKVYNDPGELEDKFGLHLWYSLVP